MQNKKRACVCACRLYSQKHHSRNGRCANVPCTPLPRSYRDSRPRRLRSFETCPLLCTDTLPCPSPPRMLSRFGDCMMRRCCGGGRRWRARRGRWWRWERGEGRRGGGSAAARGDCWRAAWRRAAGQRPPWVSTVKGHQGLAAISIAINPIFRSFFSIGRAVQSISRKYAVHQKSNN